MTIDRLKNIKSMDSPATVRFYDRIACRGGGLPFRILAKRILGLGVDKGKLLDIACGPGHLLVALAKLSPEVQLYGMDISPNILDACRKKFRFLAHLGSWWRMRKYGIEGIGHVFDASYTPHEVEDCLRNLPVRNFEIKKTRLTMTTILLNKALGFEEAL